MMVRLLFLLLLQQVLETNTSGAGAGGIRVKQTSDKAGHLNFKLSMKDDKSGEEQRTKSSDVPVKCDFTRGCLWKYSQEDYEDYLINEDIERVNGNLFSGDSQEDIQRLEELFSVSNNARLSQEVVRTLALVKTVQAVHQSEAGLDESLLASAVETLELITKRRLGVVTSAAVEAARLSSLQTKLVLRRGLARGLLYQLLGEFLFLSGRLLAAREAFLLALRQEGELDLRLSLVSSPATVIKAVLCRAIEEDYEGERTASCPADTTECPALLARTPLNSVFWPDHHRSIVHEKLEWWLAKSAPMSALYPGLHDAIYSAGELAGVYLSRYQRPINAVPGLRAKPVWTEKETGLKESLDKIRENWRVIRDEGLELMKNRRAWGVDPGWRGEIPIKGVALHKASEQAKFCQNAMFTCRLIQKFPEASGCPKCKAAFSLVEGGTVIPAHAGPTNTRLRAHLGLVVPKKGDVHMRIANKTVTWKPGKWTIIDDSFEHEILNDSEKPRLILIIDFHHPDISREENKAEFNWSKEDMVQSGLARSQEISGGFP